MRQIDMAYDWAPTRIGTTMLVFVLGAGASQEVGLPSGYELKKDICDALKRNDGYYVNDNVGAAISQHPKRDTLYKVTDNISQGVLGAKSIDKYLESHSSNADIQTAGKLTIAQLIYDAEQKSHLATNSAKFSFERLEDTWYGELFPLLTGGKNVKEFQSSLSEVAFIVFNYDRCLEEFLARATMARYHVSMENAQGIVGQVRIIHPYGSLGSTTELPFGFGRNGPTVIPLSVEERISTYSESTLQDSDTKIALEDLLRDTTKLVFLGFAYDDLNMRLLVPPADATQEIRTFGTVLGLPEIEQVKAGNQLRELYNWQKPHLESVECSTFLKNVGSSII